MDPIINPQPQQPSTPPAPQPAQIPAQQPASEPENLVFKTMPKGFGPISRPAASQSGPSLDIARQPVSPAQPAPQFAQRPAVAPAAMPVKSSQSQAPAFAAVPQAPVAGTAPIPPPTPRPIAPSPLDTPRPGGNGPGSFGLRNPDSDGPGFSWSNRRNKMVIIVGAIVLLLIIAAIIGIIMHTRAKQTQNQQAAAAQQAAQPPASQISDPWRQKYFGGNSCAQNVCGDAADPDHDGLTNLQEYKAGTDPNNADSDNDGIADGDELSVFNTDPLNPRTSAILDYTDAGDVKYKYNSRTHQPFTDSELTQIAANIKTDGLHSPTLATFSGDIISFYTNYGTDASTSVTTAGTPKQGASDRDTQRSDAIKRIAYALLKYKDAYKTYPDTTDFSRMTTQIKPYLGNVAVNTTDPTNIAPYVYVYAPSNDDSDFQLSYFSEVQNTAVTIDEAQAKTYQTQELQSQRDTQRENDVQSISGALESYSADHTDASAPDQTQKSYPSLNTWKQLLSPKYLAAIPQDPQTKQDYVYTLSGDNQTYSIRATLEIPPTGKSGYACTQDGCDFY